MWEEEHATLPLSERKSDPNVKDDSALSMVYPGQWGAAVGRGITVEGKRILLVLWVLGQSGECVKCICH